MPADLSPWLILQLADAAFPSGGFAHSGGLEASLVFRPGLEVKPFVAEGLWNAGRGSLPFAVAACISPARFHELDAACDAAIASRVQNRASRAQGRAFATAAKRIFEGLPKLGAPCHHAPAFGAIFGALRVGPRDCATAYLHGVTRTLLSAAVRLGVVGPLEAQQIQHELAPTQAEILASCIALDPDDAAWTSPLLDLFGALHDRLDGRLFQS